MDSLKFLEYACKDGSIFYLNNLIVGISILLFLFAFSYYTITTPKQVDKIQHLFISAGLTFLSLKFSHDSGFKFWWIIPIGVILIGIGKEIIDRLNPRKKVFDVKDLLADAIGVISVTVVYWALFAAH